MKLLVLYKYWLFILAYISILLKAVTLIFIILLRYVSKLILIFHTVQFLLLKGFYGYLF